MQRDKTEKQSKARVEREKFLRENKAKVLYRNVKRFRGGLVFKAHRLVYHSTLGLRVIKKEKKQSKARVERDRFLKENKAKVSEAHRLLYHSA